MTTIPLWICPVRTFIHKLNQLERALFTEHFVGVQKNDSNIPPTFKPLLDRVDGSGSFVNSHLVLLRSQKEFENSFGVLLNFLGVERMLCEVGIHFELLGEKQTRNLEFIKKHEQIHCPHTFSSHQHLYILIRQLFVGE